MKRFSLCLLRVTIGLLMVIWGLDKFANPDHGAAVAERFYFGLFGWRLLFPVFGGAQILLGLLVMGGLLRRWTYPVLAAITGMTLLGVWRSVLDPWGWYLDGTNVLFYPSTIIFAGVLVLLAFREDDRWVIGAARSDGA